MRHCSSSFVAPVMRFILGISLVLGVMRQPASAQDSVSTKSEVVIASSISSASLSNSVRERQSLTAPKPPLDATAVPNPNPQGVPPPPSFEPTDFIDRNRMVGEPIVDAANKMQTVVVKTQGQTNAAVVFDTPRAQNGSVVRGVLKVNALEGAAQFDVVVQLPIGLPITRSCRPSPFMSW